MPEQKQHRGFLAPEDIAAFHTRGYFVKRNCLSHTEIKAAEAELINILERGTKHIQDATEPAAAPTGQDELLYLEDGSRLVFRRQADGKVALVRINGTPTLLDTLRSPTMMQTFFELLGTSELEHIISQIHPKLPGDGVAYERHRDIEFRRAYDPKWQVTCVFACFAHTLVLLSPRTCFRLLDGANA